MSTRCLLICLIFFFSLTITARAGVSTSPASALTPNSATLNALAESSSQDTMVWFEWGTNVNYGHATATQLLPANTNASAFSATLLNLTLGVTYDFRAVGSNEAGVVYGTNQSFTAPTFVPANIPLTKVYDATVSWGDYDNDGRLDLLLCGSYSPVQLWQNTGITFSNQSSQIADIGGPVDFADLNNDGRLDLLAADSTLFGVGQNGGSTFVKTNLGLSFNGGQSMFSGDFNGDGLTDVFRIGDDRAARIWQNSRPRFIDGNALLPLQFTFSYGAGIDFDNDGRLDFLFSGSANWDGFVGQVWRNTPDGFIKIGDVPAIIFGSVALGDYDNDGLVDLAVSGASITERITQIWRNTGQGFTNINAGLPGLMGSSIAWGDYDNDGRLDLLITGRTAFGIGAYSATELWHNTTNGFVRINTGLAPVGGQFTRGNAVAWGDYDNDGRLDIVLTGFTNENDTTTYEYSEIWHNEFPRTNTPPLPPDNLSATFVGDGIVFTWGMGSDAETPPAGLTYNLRVGTTPQGVDLVSPMSLTNGFRQVPKMGNMQKAHTFKLTRVPKNQPIYWSVQSIDTAFAGSPFAPEKNLRINVAPHSSPVLPGDLDNNGYIDQADLVEVLRKHFINNPPSPFTTTSDWIQFSVPQLSTLSFTVLASTNGSFWSPVGPASLRFEYSNPGATNSPTRHYQLLPP